MNANIEVGFAELTAAEYHADLLALSHSQLECFRRSPQEYYERYVIKTLPRETTSSMELGTAVHLAILQPIKFAEQVLLIPDDVLTSDGKKAGKKWQEYQAANAGCSLLKRSEFNKINAIALAVESCPTAKALIDSCDRKEQAIYWSMEGVDCKALIDGLGDKVIIDLKTCLDSRPRAFAAQAARLGYHRQADWYQRGVYAVTGNTLPFIFIAVRNEPPYTVECIQLSTDFMAAAAVDNAEDLQRFIAHDARDDWHSDTYDRLVTVDAPRWLKYEDEYSLEG